jgi:hypothetical protein
LLQTQEETNHSSNNCGESNYSNQVQYKIYSLDVAFTAALENNKLTTDMWICDSSTCGYYCHFTEGLFNDEDKNAKDA